MNGQEVVVLAGGGLRAGVARKAADAYQQAFIEAYESHYTKLFAYVYSRVGNVELAKDLIAEVFEKAYVKGHGVREAAAYTTWLFMIAKNVVIGHYRRQKRENSGLTKIKDSLWLSERPTDPESDILRGEAVSNLMRHLRRLSDRDQELLALKFEGELSYGEISRVLRLSEVNVRVSIFRALKRLRSLMEEDGR
ncbi:MAG: RNA polymerase sigma factor [Dehalococcoidia bacterium]|nr:RNA polymerase sigma factor [Dehalococcoidia bacterium]